MHTVKLHYSMARCDNAPTRLTEAASRTNSGFLHSFLGNSCQEGLSRMSHAFLNSAIMCEQRKVSASNIVEITCSELICPYAKSRDRRPYFQSTETSIARDHEDGCSDALAEKTR